jgi:hypothetical protein
MKNSVWMTISLVAAGLTAGRVIVAQSAGDLPNFTAFPNPSPGDLPAARTRRVNYHYR